MKKRDSILAGIAALLCFPSLALANAGTPLIWAVGGHLLIGNAVIGTLEGLILARIFRAPAFKAVCWMIAANYLSAWAGYLLLSNDRYGLIIQNSITIKNIGATLLATCAVMYLLTLVFELPFIAVAVGRPNRWIKSITGNLLVQSVSYALMIGWFYWISSTTLLNMKVVSPEELSPSPDIAMYYISDEDGDVYRSDLRGENVKKVKELHETDPYVRLVVSPSLEEGVFDLNLGAGRGAHFCVVESFARVAAPREFDVPMPINGYDDSWTMLGPVPKLGAAIESPWEFETGFWANDGLSGTNTKSGENTVLALETPFHGWTIRNATHLPGDLVLLQLGKDQICLCDPVKKQIALIARGHGVVAAMEEIKPIDLDQFSPHGELTAEATFGEYTVRTFRDKEDGEGSWEIFRQDRRVAAKNGHCFSIGWEDDDFFPKEFVGKDITGDDIPDLPIYEWTGGAHASFIARIVELKDDTRTLDIIDGVDSVSDFKDLDHDGVFEVAILDPTFAYWPASFGDSPLPRVVLHWNNLEYVVASNLMRELPPSDEELERRASEIRESQEWKVKIPPALLQTTLDLMYSGNESRGWEFMLQAWPKEVPLDMKLESELSNLLAKSPYYRHIKQGGWAAEL